ncbi:hypothetical protein BGZ47_002158, partial [Haplosporangium gracile]
TLLAGLATPPPVPTQLEQEAASRDLARTLHKILKPQTPSPYAGAIDADACHNFIDNQEEYYQVVKLGTAEWVQYTALNLTDDAKSWWRSSGLTIHSSWPDFKQAFLDFHTPPNAAVAALTALESLRQGKRTVASYTHDFRRLRRRVPSLDDTTALHWYKKGLEKETSKEVMLRQPATLDIAITQATLVHSILYPDGPTGFKTSPQQTSDMEIDTLQVTINNLTAQVNYLARRSGYNHGQNNTKPFVYNPNTNYKPGGPLPPKLLQPEKDYLYNNGGCYKCRKLGHLGPDCRTFPSTPRPARQFNNVEVAATPALQQAFSQTQSGKANSN